MNLWRLLQWKVFFLYFHPSFGVYLTTFLIASYWAIFSAHLALSPSHSISRSLVSSILDWSLNSTEKAFLDWEFVLHIIFYLKGKKVVTHFRKCNSPLKLPGKANKSPFESPRLWYLPTLKITVILSLSFIRKSMPIWNSKYVNFRQKSSMSYSPMAVCL